MNLSQELVTNCAILFPVFMQMAGLTAAVLADPYISKRNRKVMITITALLFVLISQNIADFLLQKTDPVRFPSAIQIRIFTSVIGYTVRPIILLLFCQIISPDRRYRAVWILLIINTAVHCSAFFSHICFWIDENNHYQGGVLNRLCLWISIGLLAYFLYLCIYEYRINSRISFWIPILNILLIIASIVMDNCVGATEQIVSYLTIAMESACLFYYIWLHMQFAYAYEQDLKAAQRIQIMRTQIQPHFLFNTITTFRALSLQNPQAAYDLAGKFGQYLRQNIDSLDTSGMIPFEKELEHTKLYSEIEMVRFENIHVEYDIKDLDFEIPPLTIQPIVENAIRHGVRIRDKGIVRISSKRSGNAHEIIIKDNGIGFDLDEIEKGSREHIGIKNVKERIEKMSLGTMTVESNPDKGTIVTIRIPVSKKEESD